MTRLLTWVSRARKLTYPGSKSFPKGRYSSQVFHVQFNPRMLLDKFSRITIRSKLALALARPYLWRGAWLCEIQTPRVTQHADLVGNHAGAALEKFRLAI